MNGGHLRMLSPPLGRNRRLIRVGIALAVVAQATLATLPLIQRVIQDDTILSRRRSLGLWVAFSVAGPTNSHSRIPVLNREQRIWLSSLVAP